MEAHTESKREVCACELESENSVSVNRFFSSGVGPYPGELGKNPGALVSPFGESGKQAEKKKCPQGEM